MRHSERRLNRPQQESSTFLSVALDGPKVIKEIPAYQVSLSSIEIEYFVDSPAEKVVEAYAKKIGKIVLWEGAAYDAIGDWTQCQANDRILELL